MFKLLKFLTLFIPVICIGIFLSLKDRDSVFEFHAEGTVITAKWNTSNHQMSLFEIRPDKGRVIKLHHSRVTLTPEQIKVGDYFKKEKGSTSCFINEVEIECVK